MAIADPAPNYITPAGLAALKARYAALFEDERPKLVEVVSWAAGNGDRSENGDYLYGKKRLREIDRELGWLSRRIKAARVVDPAAQTNRTKVFFGATVMVIAAHEDSDDAWKFLTLVGDDESEAGANRVGWNSPFGRALRGASVGNSRIVKMPSGDVEYHVLKIRYPD